MEPDDDSGTPYVDELLTCDEWLAAVPAEAGQGGHQAITDPFVDADLVERG
jgi:hypothetical protein